MPLRKLIGLSLGGLVACTGMSIVFNNSLKERLKSSKLYKEAIDTAKSHPGAVLYLGEPMEDFDPSLNNSSMFFNGMVEFKTHLNGPKNKGILYVTAVGKDTSSLVLDTIQLQIESEKDKKLIIKEPEPRQANTLEERH